MKICYIMVGVSGSGKSTVVQRIRESCSQEVVNYSVFSLDDCRLDFYDRITDDPKKAYAEAFEYANNNKQQFDAYVTATWNKALKTAEVLVVDNTNLTRKARARWINEARADGFTIMAVQVVAPLEVVIARQATRPCKSVPENVVRDMYFRQQEVLAGEEADFVLNIDGTSYSNPIVGTVHAR